MEIRRNLYVSSILAASLAVTQPAIAQDLYGSLGWTLGSNDVTDNANDEGKSISVELSGFGGVLLNNGVFVETDLRLKFADQDIASNDDMSDGMLLAVRVGKDFGAFTLEGIVGGMEATTDEGTTSRHFVAVGGGYQFTPQFGVNGLIGYLDGQGGSDDGGLDGGSEVAHISLGLNYQATDRLGLNANVAYGSGIMDDDVPRDETFKVTEFSIGMGYRLPSAGEPVLSARLTRAKYEQGPTENDNSVEKRIDIGLRWDLGNKPASRKNRPELPRYNNWMGISAGVLE